jgi:chloramphenicol-sensitive protein RarD
VGANQVVQASLGYFINPLVSVLLGFVVLRERLTRLQVLAVILAMAGVIAYGWNLGKAPWIALSIAFTFGAYGLLRKMIPVDPLAGLVVETSVMLPAALATLGMLASQGSMHFFDSPLQALLFMGGGAVTAFPLLWFISAAKILPLSTLGFFQYLVPTLQLLVGVILYHEPFTHQHAAAFALIWAAIAIFLLSVPRNRPAAPVESQPL